VQTMTGLGWAPHRLRVATAVFVVAAVALTSVQSVAAAATRTTTTPPAARTTPGASAATEAGTELCEQNVPTWCASVTGQEVVVYEQIVINGGVILSGTVLIVKKFLGWWNANNNGTHKGQKLAEEYFEYGGDAGGQGENLNLCLGDTGLGNQGTPVSWQPCGANGTVWIESPDNNGGDFNFTRYSADHGCSIASPGYYSTGDCAVMTTVDNENVNAHWADIFEIEPFAPGSEYYQNWTP
jgi:hypothetical protein